jgi:metallo-beta-lactamase family protein
MSITLKFFGAAREVTGSMHLIEVNGKTVALDCGLFQGSREEGEVKNRSFPVPPAKMDALVLSHAHIDHSGKIPRLVREGFKGSIYATPATAQLASVMMADSGKIQEEDVNFVNKKRARRGDPPIEPLYVQQDAINAARLFVSRQLGQAFDVIPGVRVTFHDAGHMIGSAGMLLEIDDKAGPAIRLVFTGDIGRPRMPILKDPAPMPMCDYLLSEATYGGKMSDPPGDMREKLAAILNQTFNRSGKVIIPSFAVGRAQVLVYEMNRLAKDGRISARLPVYIDSPLALRATQVYREHPEIFDREATDFNALNGQMLDGEMFHYVQNVEESKRINSMKGPAVIIAASGMCEAGRILHHLRNNIEDPRNTVLIVGFQAVNTLGRRIVERSRTVKIFGEVHPLKARVEVLNGYSSHANAQELLEILSPLATTCKRAFLVHSEPDQAEALAAGLNRAGLDEVSIPERNAVFDFRSGKLTSPPVV